MIIRTVLRQNFSIIANSLARDRRLSFKARGVMTYLLSHAEGWEVHIEDIVANSDHDGRTAVQSAMQELKTLGYASLEYLFDEEHFTKGRQWVIRDQPCVTDEPVTGDPIPTSPTQDQKIHRTENPLDGKTRLIKNTKEEKNTETTEDSSLFLSSTTSQKEKESPCLSQDIEKIENSKFPTHADVVEFYDAWNTICASEGLPRKRKLTQAIARKIELRLRHEPSEAFWTEVLNAIPRKPFLMGDNANGWRATLEWLVRNDDNALKIVEGNFDGLSKRYA